jgi:signal transduction histidine kinase
VNVKIIKTEGIGMGLTFCRKGFEQHGGKIWAESEGQNKGSKFYIQFDRILWCMDNNDER